MSSTTSSSSSSCKYDVQVFPTVKELLACLHDELSALSKKALTDKSSSFHVGLSGGSLPQQLSTILIKDNQPTIENMHQWHFWLCDERNVSNENIDLSNFKQCYEAFIKHIPSLPQTHLHKQSEELVDKTEEAAQAYEAEVKKYLPHLSADVLLLGMGPDGHTCSLFPSHPLLNEHTRLIAPIVDSPKPPPKRITMTYPLIQKAKQSIFVITGENKAENMALVLDQIFHSEKYADKPDEILPSARIKSQERVLFLLDEAAAKKWKEQSKQ